jgi:hypothetical protein
MRGRLKILGLLLAVLIASALTVHWLRPRVVIEGPAAGSERVSLERVDHGLWDALLERYVDENGLVAYARWKKTPADADALDGYLARLGAVDLKLRAGHDAQVAFWINAYNALTIKGILREYPTTTIKNHTALFGGYNMWTDLLLEIDGEKYSLDDMEHVILRKRIGEPRVHFAVVCASIGCPPLRQRAYRAADLDSQLEDNARRFFTRPTSFRADAAGRTVYISELFDWYGTDFAPTPHEQLRVLRRYFPAAEKLSWIEETAVNVKYIEYDWDLNDQTPVPR